MPDYDEIVRKSQENIKKLNLKLHELDNLYKYIVDLASQPEAYDQKFKEIIKLTEDYTSIIGASVKNYIDSTEDLVSKKIILIGKNADTLQAEITRLSKIDFSDHFQSLKESFIEQASSDLSVELDKIDGKTKALQLVIEDIKKEAARFEAIDLEIHFSNLQKTLSDIFGAVNAINLTLTSTSQALSGIAQSVAAIHQLIDNNHNDLKQLVNSLNRATENHLKEQDSQLEKNNEMLKDQISQLAEQNVALKGKMKFNTVFQAIGFSLIFALLIYSLLGKYLGF